MLKKLVRSNKGGGRGSKAPAFLVRPSLFVRLLEWASRGYTLAGAGVLAAAVTFVSLLSWLAPDSDRPIASPLEAVGRVASGVLEQVDEQVTAMLGADGEKTISKGAREGLAAAGSRLPWAEERLREIATGRYASAGPARGSASAHQTPNTAAQEPAAQEGPSSLATTNESSAPPQATRGSSPPSSSTSSSPGSIDETAPPAEEEPTPTPTTNETAAPPPPVTEEPSPTTGEQPPIVEEPPTPPPAAEDPFPAAEEPPPTTDEQPPTVEEPPTTVEEPPTIVEEPPIIMDQPTLPPTEGPPPSSKESATSHNHPATSTATTRRICMTSTGAAFYSASCTL